MPASNNPHEKSTGITHVTRGPVDLLIPRQIPEGTQLRYGLGFPCVLGSCLKPPAETGDGALLC